MRRLPGSSGLANRFCLTREVTLLLLLRHAESEWNAAGLWQGWADPPLSPAGETHATGAGRLLRSHGFTAAESSDLRRARRTAELVSAAIGLPDPVGITPDLREYDVGDWSGLTRAEIERRWPGGIDDWRHNRLAATPGGESRQAFLLRVVAAVTRIGSADPSGPVLVITHGGVISALARSLGADPAGPGHLGGRWFDATGEGIRLGDEVAVLQPVPAPRVDGDSEAAGPDQAAAAEPPAPAGRTDG